MIPESPGLALMAALLWLLTSSAQGAGEVSVQELLSSGDLQIRSWTEPTENIIVTQQVSLHIEVATSSWYTGGTRIGNLEIDGAVVLRREKFAVNSTRRSGDKTFTVQQWSLEVYPQRAGDYTIPATPLTLSIAGEGGTSIQGQVMSPATSFKASYPAGISDLDNWIATDTFDVTENYNRALQGLSPGDAVQRQIVISADNVAAMMLPQLQAGQQSGLGVYQKPSQIADTSNRGTFRARRTETITYLIEKPGRYTLPAHTFYWWDLSRQRLESVTLPEQILEASGASTGPDTAANQPTTEASNKFRLLPWLGALVICGLLLLLWQRLKKILRGPIRGRQKPAPQASDKERRAALETALSQQDWPALVEALYRWLDHCPEQDRESTLRGLLREASNSPSRKTLDALMRAAYYRGEVPAADIESMVHGLLAVQEGKRRTGRWHIEPVELKLN